MSAMTNLEVLTLLDINVLDNIAHLAPLTKLRSLYLERTNVQDVSSLTVLSRLTNLKYLFT